MKRSSASVVVATLWVALAQPSCQCGSEPATAVSTPQPKKLDLANAPEGLDMRLSDGKVGAPAFDRSKLAAAKPLPDAEVAQLLARAKSIDAGSADQKSFALRPASQPAPRTGDTVKSTFPPAPSTLLPPSTVDANAGADLKVLRYLPEGKVPIAPELSVTFSQPMVAVTSQDDAAKTTPVKLTPTPKGRWRWIGTRTILFDPEVRFPQSTTYTVEIPAGTKSATGGTLKDGVKFTFETPPMRVVQSYPTNGSQRRDAPMFVKFDQAIDAKALLPKLKVKAGDKPWSITLLTPAEIAKHETLKYFVETAKAQSHDGRWIAFRPSQLYPADSAISVELPAGLTSTEGPNPTTESQTVSFRTYPPLDDEDQSCGNPTDSKRDFRACEPGRALSIEFNNPLDEDKFDERWVKVEPALPGMAVTVSGSYVSVSGPTLPNRNYNVTVDGKLLDEFGQTLGTTASRTFQIGETEPTFFGATGMLIADPIATAPTADYFTVGYANLKVKLFKLSAADYPAYLLYMQQLRSYRYEKKPRPTPPGTQVFDNLVATKPAPPQKLLSETGVALAPALTNGVGHVLAFVEPSPQRNPDPDDDPDPTWIQVTKLGVQVHRDDRELVAYVSDLQTGKPVGNATVELRPWGTKATTDASGVARVELLPSVTPLAHYVTATVGADTAIATEGRGWYGGSDWLGKRQYDQKRTVWHVTDDRGLYRPGEDIAFKGWIRTVDFGKGGDVSKSTDARTVSYRVVDSRGVEIAKGSIPVSVAGAFDLKLKLPDTPNLGHARLELDGYAHTHGFRIEEFRRPEFEVSAQASQGPFLVGESGDVTVSAKYFAGGGLPGATVKWTARASTTSYTPPNRDEYVFGNWQPWWGGYDDYGDGDYEYRGRYYDDDEYDGRSYRMQSPGAREKNFWQHEGKTDGAGSHTLHMDYLSLKPAMPASVSFVASVQDVNRQTFTATTALTVHPSSLYVGLRTAKPFVQPGVPMELSVIGVDIDGKAVAGTKVDVKAVRMDWEYKQGKAKQVEVDPQTCNVTTTTDAFLCKFTTAKGGQYQVTATIVDAKGRPNTTTTRFWVTGGDTKPARDVVQERIEIIPDKKEYTPGNTAELLVQSPFYPAEGIVMWQRSGIVKSERITLDGPTKIITVPIDDAMTPNLYVQVDLVGAAPRLDSKGQVDPKLPRRTAYASGATSLPVPPKHRTLKVAVAPTAAKVGPGETATMNVEVQDAAGKPAAGAEVAIIVVDESVLALAGKSYADPIGTFHRHRNAGVTTVHSRRMVKLARPEVAAATTTPGRPSADDPAPPEEEEKPDDGMDESGGTGTAMALEEGKMGKKDSDRAEGQYKMKKSESSREQTIDQARNAGILGGMKNGADPAKPKPPAADPSAPIAVRTNFNPMAAFSPTVTVDATGKASIQVKMPDNLTRYRIVAIAAYGERQFGKGESAITARLPLMVRPSPPRFLNFGDTFQLPVVVQNQTDAPLVVKLAARSTNATLTAGAGREVTVPPNDRVEVMFPAAAKMAGTARFQFVAYAPDGGASATDAQELQMPVWTPATTEGFATYGVIDDGATRQPVALPGAVVQEFGGLEVTTASTNLQALTDAMLYIVHYPFDCAEQRSSRILSIAGLKNVLSAFRVADMPSSAEIAQSMAIDLKKIAELQNSDGGWGWWTRHERSWPYLTVYVTHALAAAKEMGYSVDVAALERAKQYLRTIERRFDTEYPAEARWPIRALALYTLKKLGEVDVAAAKALYVEAGLDKMSMETLGWLLATLAGNPAAATERAAMLRHASNKVSETAGAANFTTSYKDGAHLILASDHRVDAVMLDALIQESPKSDLIPKLVTGMLGHQKKGRWLNTQENTFALLALDRYFRTYEKVTPDFVARVWLGADYAGDHAFKGRTTEYAQIDIPMHEVAARDKQDLTIQKDGKGRLYYRIGMKYAPASLKLDSADYGFVVERKYEPVDDPKDVTKQPDGTWKIKAGARVRVRITMVNENRRYHVALVDPLPAGLETLNPELEMTEPLPADPGDGIDDDDDGYAPRGRHGRYRWYGPWYEHQNMRDERNEAFTSYLYEGVHEYVYVARATTPGNFVVPPTKAEEMYMPETFGRSATDRVVIE